MRKKLLWLLLVSAACLLSAPTAAACTCAMPAAPCKAYGAASAVFVGTVTGVRVTAKKDGGGWVRAAGPRLVTFSVEQAFSGVEGPEAEVATGLGGSDCGYVFERGVSYVVYASRRDAGGRLWTSICTRTRPAAGAAEDVEFLRALAGGESGGTLSGTVSRVRRSVGAGDWRPAGPVPGASLTVEGPGLSRELRADAEGRFSLSGLRPGTYRVRLTPPEGLAADGGEKVFLVAERGCAEVHFSVFQDGRIGGRVTDAEGRPAPEVRLTLYEADDPGPAGFTLLYVSTDAEGRYEFGGLPPGRYRLAVNSTGPAAGAEPAGAPPRASSSGPPEAAAGEVITLGEGERSLGHDRRLSSRRAAVAAELFVMWADGRPVADAHLTLKDESYDSLSPGREARADAEGRFVLNGFEGQTFVVEAAAPSPTGQEAGGAATVARSAPLRVTLSDPPAPVRLVVVGRR